jgi:hypothetical protein
MCRPVTCSVCGRTTWEGCGRHVEEVRRTVPASRWCPGHAPEPERKGFLARLLGR